MDLRQLRALVTLAQEQHFGRAAARLHIAQPALSQLVKQVERELGGPLFHRTTRRVELTEAGRLLVERATGILADTDRALTDVTLLTGGQLGRVAVGFVGTATYDLLPRVARQVRAELPGLVLDLKGERLSPELADSVRSGRIDLAVLRPTQALDDLVVRPLRREPLIAVLPAGHRLAQAESVDLAHLAADPFVLHPSGHRSSMHEQVLAACRAAGFTPRDQIEVAETATLVVFVAAGLGVALVPAPVQALRLDGVVYRPLGADPPAVELVLARRPTVSAGALRVADMISAYARSPAEPV